MTPEIEVGKWREGRGRQKGKRLIGYKSEYEKVGFAFTLNTGITTHKPYKRLWIEVRISYQRPEDVDGKQGDGEGDQTHSLQSALQLQVVLGSPQAQPARDGCQGGDEKKAGHVTQQGALLTPGAWVLQPLSNDKENAEERRTCWPLSTQLLIDSDSLTLFVLLSVSALMFFSSYSNTGWFFLALMFLRTVSNEKEQVTSQQ